MHFPLQGWPIAIDAFPEFGPFTDPQLHIILNKLPYMMAVSMPTDLVNDPAQLGLFQWVLTLAIAKLVALEGVVKWFNFTTDTILIGLDVDHEKCDSIILDRQVEAGDHLLSNRQ